VVLLARRLPALGANVRSRRAQPLAGWSCPTTESFAFVFNPQLLFISVHSWWEVTLVSVTATVAALLFAAATMASFRTRCNTLEIALLLVATFLFFRPDWVIDYAGPEFMCILVRIGELVCELATGCPGSRTQALPEARPFAL
jgi:hypothetical protein